MKHAKLKETSNQSDWSMPVQFIDRTTGNLVDLTGSSVQIAVAATTPPPDVNYRGWYGYGTGAPNIGRRPVLVGSTDTGEVTIAGPGMLMVYFPVTRMQSLPAGMYKVGMTLANAGLTVQLFIGYLPVRDGVVMPAMVTA
jgi:hypothetical protein